MMINKLPGFSLSTLANMPPPRPGATYKIRVMPDPEAYRSESSIKNMDAEKDLANRLRKLRAALSRTSFSEVNDGEYITLTVKEAK